MNSLLEELSRMFIEMSCWLPQGYQEELLDPDRIKMLILAAIEKAGLMLGYGPLSADKPLPPEFCTPLWKRYVVLHALVKAFEECKQIATDRISYMNDALGLSDWEIQRKERCKELEELGEENCDPDEWEFVHRLFPWEEGFMWPGEATTRDELSALHFCIVRIS